jgi:glycosyltransferase involved in cell wall biosynthesis
MIVLNLSTSPFFGGPERQMVGLARAMPADYRIVFLLFRDNGNSQAFRGRLEENGLESRMLRHDTPHMQAMISEIADCLRGESADLLCCHGYKADIVGLLAARRVGVPVIGVSRGWTGGTLKVRLYEQIDRVCLRWMDRVVCVSEGQAVKVRRAGVRPDRVVVILNAICADRFDQPDPADRVRLEAMFPIAPERIVGSAGRLSPEKGFGVLVEAAGILARSHPGVGFVHFGDGPLQETLSRRIAELGLEGQFILAGFRDDLDRFLPHWDLAVLPSFTEGLPNVVLEAFAAGVPVVATAVGGTPEVVEDGSSGYLVPPGDPEALARRIVDSLLSEEERQSMGQRGRKRILTEFTFAAQSNRYQQLWRGLMRNGAVIQSPLKIGRRQELS